MDTQTAIDLIANTNNSNFRAHAKQIFRFQFEHCPVYREYLNLTGYADRDIPEFTDTTPFLPVGLFKSREVIAEGKSPGITFYSSSTGGKGPSRHLVAEVKIYEHCFLQSFRSFYGDPSEWCFLCLLPGYLERQGSSLVYMAAELIRQSRDPKSGFFLEEHELLHDTLTEKIRSGKKTLLLGVSYALLDFSQNRSYPESTLVVMETGGMKGRRREMVRGELHALLCERFGVRSIHSEYGMTELLSQAYSDGGGRFRCPPWMQVMVRDQGDPFSEPLVNQRGRICVIDSGNVFSCSFIETEDLGIVYDDGTFEVLGRLDHSDLRGCNVLVAR